MRAVFVAAATIVLIAGCAWLRWRSLALTHAELLERLALDAAEAFAAPDRGLEPADIERLRYPMERGRAFAETSRRRFDGEAWLAAFDRMLGAYAELVEYLDKARTRRRGRRPQHARTLADKVAETAAEVRRELQPVRDD